MGQFRNTTQRWHDAEPAATADTERLNLLVSRLARPDANDPPPRRVVVLTATAGIPGWEDACSALAGALALAVPPGQSAADVARTYLSGQGAAGGELFWRAYPAIVPSEPPLGYLHLANLAATGRIDLVLTTAWDPLLDIAFGQVLRPFQYRVITRGELDDAAFANALLQRGIPQIVKLNGDLHSNLVTRADGELGSFAAEPGIATALMKVFSGALVIADSSRNGETEGDATFLTTLAADASLVCNVGRALAGHPYYSWLHRHTRITNNAVTDFDTFMIELDRQVGLADRRRCGPDVRRLQDEMIRSLRPASGRAADIPAHNFDYGPHPRSVGTFKRPWGSGEVFTTAESCSARVLTIDAAQKISLHRHLHRDELFVALDDGVGVDISGDEFEGGIGGEADRRIESVTLPRGARLLVPRGVWHRMHAPGARVRVLEIAFGIQDEEFDIERLLDLYGRADRAD
jgi:mannose-1-phosphate guanylyltransferase/mannose-6-phosphate isomerase